MTVASLLEKTTVLVRCGLFLLLVGAVWTVGENQAEAQYGYQRYRPSTPVLSPYLGLTASNNGVLPNYFAFVRPMQNAQQTIQNDNRMFNQQRQELLRQRNELQQLQSEFGQGAIAPTGQAGWFKTGARQGGGFRNTSHYYQRWSR